MVGSNVPTIGSPTDLSDSLDTLTGHDVPTHTDLLDSFDARTNTVRPSVLTDPSKVLGAQQQEIADVAFQSIHGGASSASLGNLLGDVNGLRIAAANGNAVSDLSIVDMTADQFLGARVHFDGRFEQSHLDALMSASSSEDPIGGASSHCLIEVGELDFGQTERGQHNGPLFGKADIQVDCPAGQPYSISNMSGHAIAVPAMGATLRLYRDEQYRLPFDQDGNAIRGTGHDSVYEAELGRRHTVYAVLQDQEDPEVTPRAGAIEVPIRIQISTDS